MKNCHNCYYFYKHYIKDKQCNLVEVLGCGHCIHLKVPSKTFKKYFRMNSACDYWENGEKQGQERAENLKISLTKIADRLEELREIFED